MSVIYSTALKNNRLDEVTALIDAGAGAGEIRLGTAAMALVLATIALADPAAPVAAAGVLTFTMPRSDTSADATGIAVEADIRDDAAAVIVSGLTVGTGGTDIILDSTNITIGQTVTLNTATITHG